MNKENIKQIQLCAGLFALSAVMLTVIQEPFGIWPLAWVCYIPFVLASTGKIKTGTKTAIIYTISLLYWLGNLYWIGYTTKAGWVAFCIYTAFLWPLMAVAIRFCYTKKIPLVIACPVIIAGAQYVQGFGLGGFHWRLLAHSQYENIALIQMSDIFGAGGLSVLIASVNGLLCDLMIDFKNKKTVSAANITKASVVAGLLAASLIYGKGQIYSGQHRIKQGPLAAAIQSNVPQRVKESLESEEVIFSGLEKDSLAALNAGAVITVWPETMVQAILNERFWPVMERPEEYIRLSERLKDHVRGRGYVLVGAYNYGLLTDSDGEYYLGRYNSAFMYNPDGNRDKKIYNKIHLVPFGEVLPLADKVSWIKNLLVKFTPYEYDYSLSYGEEYTVFEIKTENGEKYRFGTIICYEETVPEICRKFTIDENGKKRIDWLFDISNDGWFVKYSDGNIKPSTELAQRVVIAVFRAVENRISVVRSVNTGISCMIDPLGRIIDGYSFGNLPVKAAERKAVAGWFADNVPIDSKVTFFSRFGPLVDKICAVGFAAVLACAVITRRKTKGKAK